MPGKKVEEFGGNLRWVVDSSCPQRRFGRRSASPGRRACRGPQCHLLLWPAAPRTRDEDGRRSRHARFLTEATPPVPPVCVSQTFIENKPCDRWNISMNKTWPLSSKSRKSSHKVTHTLSHTAKTLSRGFTCPWWGIIIISIAIIINIFLSQGQNGPFSNTNSFNSYTNPVRYSIITGPSISTARGADTWGRPGTCPMGATAQAGWLEQHPLEFHILY